MHERTHVCTWCMCPCEVTHVLGEYKRMLTEVTKCDSSASTYASEVAKRNSSHCYIRTCFTPAATWLLMILQWVEAPRSLPPLPPWRHLWRATVVGGMRITCKRFNYGWVTVRDTTLRIRVMQCIIMDETRRARFAVRTRLAHSPNTVS